MRTLFALVLAAGGGCGFQHGATSTGDDDMPVIDSSIDGVTVNPGAEPTLCVAGFLNLCGQAAPTMTLDAPGVDSINTDTDPRCRTLAQTNGGDVCLVYVTSATVSGQLVATGTRPLAIASTSTISISGVIDVASRSGKTGPSMDGNCTFSATPEMDIGGAGGGAGGSFGAAGGDGGHGDSDTSLGVDGDGAPGLASTALAPMVLRGGCRGQAGANESAAGQVGGTGGHSGGGLYLYAATSLTLGSGGVIRASGAGGGGGGAQAGGGGGGTGGMVVVESPQMTIAGTIAANGGGGGEGGARVGTGSNTSNVNGQPGTDGTATTTPAPGGQGSDIRFGFGGAGGAGSTAAVTGTTAATGGGGGGGAVGIIHLIGTSTVTGTLTPGAT